MKIAYIAGPYRGDVETNIAAAKLVACKYWRQGYAVVCPHMNSAFMDGIVDDEKFLLGYIEILKRCDVIVMMKNYIDSVGATIELEVAKDIGLEIIYDES